MAETKEETAPAVQATAAKEKKKGPLTMIMAGLLFGGSLWFIYPSLLMLIGMLPTVVAIFTAKENGRNASVAAVGALNAAGVSPFLIDLWQGGQTLPHALTILSAPETWAVMFGGAAIGQLILFAVPHAIAYASVANAEVRIKTLKANLDQLQSAWGPDVATTKPLADVAPAD